MPNIEVCISLQYLQKNVRDEIDFLPVDNTKFFNKLMVSLWVWVARYAQVCNIFAISQGKREG